MGLLDIVELAKSATHGLGGLAEKQSKEWLGDFQKAVDVLETFGFTVGRFSVSMGALPELNTTLEGSIEKIQEDRIQKMIDEHKTDELLVALLKALIWVRWGWAHMELKKLTGVTLYVTLGLPPRIRAEVH